MKKLIAFVAILGIAFSSCNGKYTIAKRKYNKGFYIAKSGNNNTKPSLAPRAASVVVAEEKVESVVVAKTIEAPVTIAAIEPVKEVVSKEMKAQASPAQHSHKTAPVASTAKNNYAPASEIKPLEFNRSILNAAKGKGDGNLVLMIILCFLWWLNLIAVYMHDGGVTTNFWITLLLDFTLIGGVIFSLLVVLDVVDLS